MDFRVKQYFCRIKNFLHKNMDFLFLAFATAMICYSFLTPSCNAKTISMSLAMAGATGALCFIMAAGK